MTGRVRTAFTPSGRRRHVCLSQAPGRPASLVASRVEALNEVLGDAATVPWPLDNKRSALMGHGPDPNAFAAVASDCL